MSYKTIILVLLPLFITSQSELLGQNGEKEIIIIEKSYDENGNVISKKTKRLNGVYTEEEINDLIEEDNMDQIRSFDMEGMGFEDLFQDMFRSGNSDARPTIGVNLSFNDGNISIDQVTNGSGAAAADVREGDQIISIEGVAVSTIDDIYEILDTKSAGSVIRVLLIRNGRELNKEIRLGGNAHGSFFGFPEGQNFEMMGGDFENMDSLFQQFFKSQEFPSDLFNFDNRNAPSQRGDKSPFENHEPVSLGAYINDEKGVLVIAEVISGSAAETAGLQEGDVILRMDDELVSTFSEVKAIMNLKEKGDSLIIDFERAKRNQQVEVQF